jgi:hypothetical protein
VKNVETPEINKLKAVQPVSQQIGEFIRWLTDEKKIVFATWHNENEEDEEEEGRLWPEPMGDAAIEKLLAEFFHIDLNKVEQEKRAILEDLRKRTGKNNQETSYSMVKQ